MSTMPSGLPRLYPGQRLTADEFLAVGETEERFELVDGIVMMSPSPSALHQLLVFEIGHQLALARDAGADLVVLPDTDHRFAPSLVYRPDLSVYSTDRFGHQLEVPPQLVIEVLSPSNPLHDLLTKKRDYQRFGVDEYIVVDPKERQFSHFVREQQGEHSGLAERLEFGSTLELAVFPGVLLDLESLRSIINAHEK